MIIPCTSCQSTFRLDNSLVKPAGSRVRCSKCRVVFKVYPPKGYNRRTHKSSDTRNLISYASYDLKGNLTSKGLGQVLDISKGGMLLETKEPIKSSLIFLTATDVKNNLLEIDGNLLYCKKTSIGKYNSKVSYIANEEESVKFITKLANEFNFRKK